MNSFYLDLIQEKTCITEICAGKFLQEDADCFAIVKGNAILEIWVKNSEQFAVAGEIDAHGPLFLKYGQIEFNESIICMKRLKNGPEFQQESEFTPETLLVLTESLEWSVLECHENGLQRISGGEVSGENLSVDESSIVLDVRNEDDLHPAICFLHYKDLDKKSESFGIKLEPPVEEIHEFKRLEVHSKYIGPKFQGQPLKFESSWSFNGVGVETINIFEAKFLISKQNDEISTGSCSQTGKPIIALLCQVCSVGDAKTYPAVVAIHIIAMDFENQTFLDGGWGVYNVPVMSKICPIPNEMLICVSFNSILLFSVEGLVSKLEFDLSAFPSALVPCLKTKICTEKKTEDNVECIVADCTGNLYLLQIQNLKSQSKATKPNISTEKILLATEDEERIYDPTLFSEVSQNLFFIGSKRGDCSIIHMKKTHNKPRVSYSFETIYPEFSESLGPIVGGSFIHRSREFAVSASFQQEESEHLVLEEPITLALACGQGSNGAVCVWEHGIKLEELQQGDLGLPQNITLIAAGDCMARSDWLFFSDSVCGTTYIMEVSEEGEAQPVETCPFVKSELTLAAGALNKGYILQVTTLQIVVASVTDAAVISSFNLKVEYGAASLAAVAPSGYVCISTTSGCVCLLQATPMGQINVLFCDRSPRQVSALSIFADRPALFPDPPSPVFVAAALWDSSTVRIIQSVSSRSSVQVHGAILRSTKSQIRALCFLDNILDGYKKQGMDEESFSLNLPLLVAGFTDGRVAVARFKGDAGRPTSTDNFASTLEDIGEFSVLHIFQIGCDLVKLVPFTNPNPNEEWDHLDWAPRKYIYANCSRDAVIHFSPGSVDSNVPVVCTSVSPPTEEQSRRYVVQLTQSQEPHSVAWLSPSGELGLGFLHWGSSRQGSWRKRKVKGEVMAVAYLPDLHCIAVAVDRKASNLASSLDLFDAETLNLCFSQGVVQNHQITSIVSFSAPSENQGNEAEGSFFDGSLPRMLLALSCVRRSDCSGVFEVFEGHQGSLEGVLPQPTSMVAIFEVIQVKNTKTSTIQLRPCSGVDFSGACFFLESLGNRASHLVAAVDGSFHILGWMDKRQGQQIPLNSSGEMPRPSTAEQQRYIFSSINQQLCSEQSCIDTAITAMATKDNLVAVAQLFHGILMYQWTSGEEGQALHSLGTYVETSFLSTILKFHGQNYLSAFDLETHRMFTFRCQLFNMDERKEERHAELSLIFELTISRVVCALSGSPLKNKTMMGMRGDGSDQALSFLSLGTCDGQILLMKQIPETHEHMLTMIEKNTASRNKDKQQADVEKASELLDADQTTKKLEKCFLVDENNFIIGYRKPISLPVHLNALKDLLKNDPKGNGSHFTDKETEFLIKCYWELSLCK
mmetsp:Transcript_36617/g.46656  ORF Transcript_36617/g.46656 Transcript_36617/m.46656 type:complete len:1370 (+) Transcript_36617:82-4191(+)